MVPKSPTRKRRSSGKRPPALKRTPSARSCHRSSAASHSALRRPCAASSRACPAPGPAPPACAAADVDPATHAPAAATITFDTPAEAITKVDSSAECGIDHNGMMIPSNCEAMGKVKAKISLPK